MGELPDFPTCHDLVTRPVDVDPGGVPCFPLRCTSYRERHPPHLRDQTGCFSDGDPFVPRQDGFPRNVAQALWLESVRPR